ncbi:MAG TPA: NAD(P)-dependent oxidoreductase, partial [Actinomycetota bacterium]|nr:NAD(P)-dependent oxidoreductase [Actinomycetota bacterium]
FVAGATGAIGQRLVPRLIARGHEVVGMTRSTTKAQRLAGQGVEPVVADALDREAVMAALQRSAPEVVVHQLTALSTLSNIRRFVKEFEATNRLRTHGTDHLLDAATAAGARRFVAQSYAGWPYARDGGPVKTEDDPLDADPPKAFRAAFGAIRHLERRVTQAREIEGLVLRYGVFYGPGTGIAPGGAQLEEVRRRRFPVVGAGGGVWSFIHIDDAAEATVAAIEGGAPGVYNIVDDDPAPVSEWLPTLAAEAGAPPPRRAPAWLARVLAGEHGVVIMTEARGASNAKAKRDLGWRPKHPSWRQGFADMLRSPHPEDENSAVSPST